MNERIAENFEANEKLAFGAAAVITAAMMFCAGLTIEQFLRRLAPGWDLGFLPWMAFLAAVESIYSQAFVHRWSEFGWERISYRLSEALVIVFLVKGIFYLRMGGAAFVSEISRYGQHFLESFFTAEMSAALLTCFLLWIIAARMAAGLLELGDDRLILEPGARPDFFVDRDLVRRRLAGTIFFFGAVLVFLASLTRIDLEVVWGRTAVIEATAFNVVVYFVLGLVLLSLAQFSVMRGRWSWERAPIRRDIGRAWLRYSAVFFLLVAAVILVLPTGYSLSLFETITVFFRFLGGLAAFLFYLLMLPLMLLVSRFMNEDVMESLERPENPFFDQGQLPEDPGMINAAPVPFWEFLQSVLFWAAFLFLIIYAFMQFARHNEAVWQRIVSVPLLRWLAAAWEGLVGWLVGVGKRTEEAVQAGLRQIRDLRTGRRVLPGWDFVGVNRLSPRERVFFFYRAMLRRASEDQVHRRGSQTPQEFRRTLEDAYPEAVEELRGLTAGFESARYAPAEVDESDAGKVKNLWENLRRWMRKGPDEQAGP